MTTRGIRGAITVDNNTDEAIKEATVEILTKILDKNQIETENISHLFFTVSQDINAAFPAKFARTELHFDYVPMLCHHELDVPGSIPLCLRVLMVINSDKSQKEIHHVYAKGAKKLRPDLEEDL